MAKPHTRQQARQAARRQAKEQARHAPKGTVQTATAQLDARIGLLGLPSLAPQESLAFHIHQHLDIFVHGKQETVPALVGITAAGEFAVLHTHDTSGVMHVESPVQRTFTLGDFFNVWGLYFTQSCVGTYCAGSGSVLRVYVN